MVGQKDGQQAKIYRGQIDGARYEKLMSLTFGACQVTTATTSSVHAWRALNVS